MCQPVSSAQQANGRKSVRRWCSIGIGDYGSVDLDPGYRTHPKKMQKIDSGNTKNRQMPSDIIVVNLVTLRIFRAR